MTAITQANYNEKIKDGISVVDIGASWCPDCRRIEPIMAELEAEFKGKINFYSVSFDTEEALKDSLNIRRIPTLIFYKNGEEVGERLIEPGSKQKILSVIDSIL